MDKLNLQLLLPRTAQQRKRLPDSETLKNVEANFRHQQRGFLSEITSESDQSLEAQRHFLVHEAAAEMMRRDAHSA